MYNLNNLDFIILAIVIISALIALNRGLIKEVLSIVGWVLSTIMIVYSLPVCVPFVKKYIENGIIAGVATSLAIFVIFFIVWIYTTSSVVGKIRTSKLNGLDRFLGLFFGVMRAFLLIVLFNIMMSWIIPNEKQPEFLAKSKYYQLAGTFAKPLENMIPQETLKLIKDQTLPMGLNEKDKTNENEKEDDEAQILFEKLAKPQIKKVLKEELSKEAKGYKENEREDLERLIESVDSL